VVIAKGETIMNWYVQVLKKYADFSGRARRKEYWLFILFNILISLVLTAIDFMIGTYSASLGMGLLGGIYACAVLIPAIAVTVRRLHDTDRSGWWFLLVLIPIIGPIVLLVFMIIDGTPGSNRFGPSPKEVAPAAVASPGAV
jgi:uncharacterized membrane protein YhaH (DUF805 family)